MAPQRETTGFAVSESTFYGALELKNEQSASSGRLKYVAGLAFVAVAMTAAALAFAPTAQTSVAAVVDAGAGGDGDDLFHDNGDCACASGSQCTAIAGTGYGYCEPADTACVGIGFDYTAVFDGADDSVTGTASGTSYIRCEVVQGQYDCYGFPCLNNGYCIDGVDEYTCSCPFGYEGKNCEIEIDECKTTTTVTGSPVCHEFATCANAVPLESGKAYTCECNPGFFGDGYGSVQTAIQWGSVLASDNTYGWLERDASITADVNGDGVVDRFGCTDINDCASNPCLNGGRCIDLWDGAYDNAGTRATLEDRALSQSNAFECDCTVTLPATRWAGAYCEQDVDECTSGQHNCDNADRSTCTNSEGSFSCMCQEYWEGDGYSPDTAPADWGCTTASGCAEQAGYGGCTDVDDCTIRTTVADATGTSTTISSPCQNGGTCSNDGLGTGLYRCFCVVGWRGHDCEIDINECEEFAPEDLSCDTNAYCSNTPGSWTCLCNNGWTGNGNVDGGCYDADDCEFSPCQHGGTCTDCGTLCYICDCIVGWRGKSCETDWNECVMGIHTCHEFAMCINVPGSFECECEPGYSGDGYELCNEVNDCNYYSDDASVDDATLVDYGKRVYDATGDIDTTNSEGEVTGATWMDDYPIACGADGWTCYEGNAEDGTTLSNVPVHQCGEFDPARKIFQQHGNCEDVGPAAFICTCQTGWSDSNCDLDIDECARATDTCHKYATCTNTDGSFTCACNTGFSGDGVGTCHDIDDCSVGSSTCDKGFCTDLGVGDFRCTCDAGWTDRLCDQDINECSSMTHTCYVNNEQCYTTEQCKNGSKKNEDTGKMEYGLKEWADPCKMNAAGEIVYEPCDTKPKLCKVLQWKDDAKTVPKFCKNDYKNAQCTNTDGSFKCACRDGFVGDGIGAEGCTDVDECGSAPCENGECMDDGPLSYACTCDEGWTDTNCDADVNECLSGAHDCHVDGKCVNVPGAYYCRCVSGFTGDGYTCTDLDDCDPDPCDPVHGTCNDNGANKYVCHCEIGFGGMGCEQDEVECMIGTHGCHPNADCFNTYGSHICVCKREFYGDGKECAPCTQCMADCADNEDFTICPGHDDYNGIHDIAHVQNNPDFCPSSHSCGHGPGYINDVKKPPCAAIDRTCIQINECELMLSDCDPEKAKCTDNEGSFVCECLIGTFGGKQYWGDGRTCIDCTVCPLGSYMLADCTSTSDRFCAMTVPDGNYALETYSGDTAQCLVHWGDIGKIFPERYSWGGRLGTPLNAGDTKNGMMPGYGSQSVGKYEMWGGGGDDAANKDLVPSPDVCANPICGVCDYDDVSPGENMVRTMEAVWTFRHLEDDLYIILNGAGGQGFRCLGFQEPTAPYPASIVWEGTTMIEDFGSCVDINGTAIGHGIECKTGDGQCEALGEGAHCKVSAKEAGEWRTELDGVELKDVDFCGDTGEEEGEWKLTGNDGHTPGVPSKMKSAAKCDLAYFCGFTDTEVGSAKLKLIANGGAVWNVRPLACQGLMCQSRWTSEMYTVRTMSVGDQNMNNDARDDGRCLYFPVGIGAIPEMTPEAPSLDGLWLGIGKDADADANGDPECGIALLDATGEEQNARFNAGGNKNVEGGTIHDGEKPTQEKELLINKQAVFKFVPLPAF